MAYYQSVFKGNDIRGSYPEEINEKFAFRLGQALVSYFQCPRIVIGRDIRISSENLFQALAEGITSFGADVVDLGLVSTDAFYFAVARYNFEGGVMITASHRPLQDNGFKICKKGGEMLYLDNGLKELQAIVEKDELLKPLNSKKGQLNVFNIHEEYLKHLKSFIKNDIFSRSLKIALDTSHGMAGLSIEEIVQQLPLSPLYLNLNLDGNFPAHSPNCNDPQALNNLAQTVLTHKLDLGVIFDGDADRVAFVDEKGQIVSASTILALLVKYFLEKQPQAKVVYDSASSRVVEETILRYHGIPLRAPIGHSFMKAVMKANDALLGGEHTGHFYFKDNFYADSGMITFLLVIQIILRSQQTFSELIKNLNPYFHSPEYNYRQSEGYEEKLAKVEEYYQKQGLFIEHYDGLIIKHKDYWIHIHPANTEPFIRVNLEANDLNLLKEKEEELQILFSNLGFIL